MQELDGNAIDLARIVRPGDGIIWGQSCAEPQTLTEALVAQRAAFPGISVFLGAVFSQTFQPEHSDCIRFQSIGAIGLRKLARVGKVEVCPVHISRVGPLIEQGFIPCDVAFVQLSPPDAEGRYSLGLAADYVRSAMRRARVVVAEINAQVPRVPCAEPVTVEEIDYFVRSDRPLIQVPAAEVGEVERRIASHAQGFIPDRATVQMGIGGVPEAVMQTLRDRRDLGVHSGMIGDSYVDLVECGAITNAYKEVLPGVSVAGVLIGTDRLYRFAHEFKDLKLYDTAKTQSAAVLAQLGRLVTINSAIEIDLTGQVNAEVVGNNYLGAVGGQVDFVRGGNVSPGGRSIITLGSRTASNSSKIVNRLSGPVTTARSDVDLVITEYGVADLRGASLEKRIRSLIEIAAPEHREQLGREAHALRGGGQ